MITIALRTLFMKISIVCENISDLLKDSNPKIKAYLSVEKNWRRKLLSRCWFFLKHIIIVSLFCFKNGHIIEPMLKA